MAERADAKAEAKIVIRNKGMHGPPKTFDIPPEMLRSFARVDEGTPHPDTGELGVLVLEPQYEVVASSVKAKKSKQGKLYLEVPIAAGPLKFEGQAEPSETYPVIIG